MVSILTDVRIKPWQLLFACSSSRPVRISVNNSRLKLLTGFLCNVITATSVETPRIYMYARCKLLAHMYIHASFVDCTRTSLNASNGVFKQTLLFMNCVLTSAHVTTATLILMTSLHLLESLFMSMLRSL